MNGMKITIIAIITLLILAISTAVIANIKPQMHKNFQLENIIFKRSK